MKKLSINDIDKEIIKANEMNTKSIEKMLKEMGSESNPQPNYAKIRNSLLPKNSITAYKRRYNRWAVAAISLVALFVVSVSTIFAARLIYEWITVVEIVQHEQIINIDNIEEAEALFGNGLNLPLFLLDNYSIALVNDVDFGVFRALLIVFMRQETMLTLTIMYEHESMEDILFFVPNISQDANLVVNGINIVQMRRESYASSFWEINGMIYMLSGEYTEEELIEIIRSIP